MASVLATGCLNGALLILTVLFFTLVLIYTSIVYSLFLDVNMCYCYCQNFFNIMRFYPTLEGGSLSGILRVRSAVSFGGKLKLVARACGMLEKNKMEALAPVALFPTLTRWKRPLATFNIFSLLAITLCRLPEALSAQLSAERSLVFGPGVSTERAGFPVNYFYIQAVDTKGKK